MVHTRARVKGAAPINRHPIRDSFIKRTNDTGGAYLLAYISFFSLSLLSFVRDVQSNIPVSSLSSSIFSFLLSSLRRCRLLDLSHLHKFSLPTITSVSLSLALAFSCKNISYSRAQPCVVAAVVVVRAFVFFSFSILLSLSNIYQTLLSLSSECLSFSLSFALFSSMSLNFKVKSEGGHFSRYFCGGLMHC